MENFHKSRNISANLKLREILKTLPLFCEEFFIGIENRTSALTRLGYVRDLQIFFNYLKNEKIIEVLDISKITLDDLNKVKSEDLERYLSFLSVYENRSNGAEGKSRKLYAVRTMFKYFFNKNRILSNVASKVSAPKKHLKEIVRLEVNEVVRLLDSVENGELINNHEKGYFKKTKTRDVAILTLFLGTGMRISECVGLNISDLDFKNNSLAITRKGGHRAIIYFSDEVKLSVETWLVDRNLQIDEIYKNELKNNPLAVKPKIDALFLSLQNKRIGVRAVENLVRKYSRKIVPTKRITPHKLRSTFGTNLYRETGDIYMVADVLGHKDINTTQKHYAAQHDENRRIAAKVVKLRED